MTKIEQAARALALSQSGVDEWDALDEAFQENIKEHVRAVLRAVREPSEGMLSDGAFQIFRGERITADDLAAAKRVWRAMTNTALTE